MIIDGKATMAANTEIQKMLSKLRTLIPGIPQNRKMTKLQIMQHVIDYIAELETVLEQQNGGNDVAAAQSLALMQSAASAVYHHHSEMVN